MRTSEPLAVLAVALACVGSANAFGGVPLRTAPAGCATSRTALHARAPAEVTGPNFPPAARGYSEKPKWAQGSEASTDLPYSPPASTKAASSRPTAQKAPHKRPQFTADGISEAVSTKQGRDELLEDLQDRVSSAPAAARTRISRAATGLRARLGRIQGRVQAAVGTIRTDVVAPVVHLAENPIRLQYGLAMAARLSYFVSQQAIVSATVDGKRTVDPLAVGRAVVAALGNGREEELLEALRIQDDFITSKDAYAWWKANLKGILDLLMKEADSIETGVYKLPYDMNPTSAVGRAQYNPALLLKQFAAYHKSARAAHPANPSVAAVTKAQFVAPGRYPKYFLQNGADFLSAAGAEKADYELDSRVWGLGDAMRRRALVKIDEVLAQRGGSPSTASLLDVGAGSGHFLTFVRDNHKLLQLTALDLNLFALAQARASLGGRSVTFVEANAEAMPCETESMDLVTCTFVLSSMPADAQHKVMQEMARCLKPGGSLIIVDYTQPEADGSEACTFHALPSSTLSRSSSSSRAPAAASAAVPGAPPAAAYSAYLKTDLEYALIKAGLYVGEREVNWVSKVLVATKPVGIISPAPRRTASASGPSSSGSSRSSSNSSVRREASRSSVGRSVISAQQQQQQQQQRSRAAAAGSRGSDELNLDGLGY